MIIIREAVQADFPLLFPLWYENLALTGQADRFQYADISRERWLHTASLWSQSPDHVILGMFDGQDAAGFVMGEIRLAPPGLGVDALGVITEFVVDAHNYRGGAAREMVAALRDWFSERGVSQLAVMMPRSSVTGQAFWRAYGSVEWMQLLWVKS